MLSGGCLRQEFSPQLLEWRCSAVPQVRVIRRLSDRCTALALSASCPDPNSSSICGWNACFKRQAESPYRSSLGWVWRVLDYELQSTFDFLGQRCGPHPNCRRHGCPVQRLRAIGLPRRTVAHRAFLYTFRGAPRHNGHGKHFHSRYAVQRC